MAKKELSESEKIFIRLNVNAYNISMCKAHDNLTFNGAHISYYQNEFESDFELLYQDSRKDVFFWQYCQFEVYEKLINEREKTFLIKFEDANKLAFYENELKILNKSYKEINPVHPFERQSIFYKPKPQFAVFSFEYELKTYIFLTFLSNELTQKIKYTHNRKVEYIKELITNQQKEQSEKQSIQEREIFYDYSGNKQNERIVFLHELGILDYLEQKIINEVHNFSANKLAEVISTFTGIKQGTVQSYLNPIYSKGIDKKNSPLTKENLKNVKEKLMKIGFNNTKTS